MDPACIRVAVALIATVQSSTPSDGHLAFSASRRQLHLAPCRGAVRTFDACQLALQRLRLRPSRLFKWLFAKDSEQPSEPSWGRLCGRRGHTAGWPSAGCVASLADKTCSEPHDSEILVLLGSRLAATPRTHSRQASKSSLTLPDASRSPSKCAT